MNHLLVVNGIEAPLRRLFGCDCARCTDPSPQANTSVSLISLDDQQETVHHILFDVGVGVVDSLVRSPYLVGSKARLDWLVLTHWHPDHTLGMNALLVAYHLMRKRAKRPYPKVPVWCRSGTSAWLDHNFDFEYHNFMTPYLSNEYEPPGTVLSPLPIALDGVTITPVTVSHFNADFAPNGSGDETSYSCAAYVIETAATKIALLWDIDNLNEWIIRPTTLAEEEAVSTLSGADHLFIDTAFWNAWDRPTSHPSFENVCRYASALQPKETLLVHLSGHPDGPGHPGFGWTNGRWQAEAMQVWEQENLPGQVRVPMVGEEFTLIS